MMLKIINNPLWSCSRFGFASPAAASDYYSLLAIERAATLGIELVSIDELGGWAKVQPEHFGDGGVFGQIFTAEEG